MWISESQLNQTLMRKFGIKTVVQNHENQKSLSFRSTIDSI